MVLAQLGHSISKALAKMSDATVVDDKVLCKCINDISCSLMDADVQVKMVYNVQAGVRRAAAAAAAGVDKRRVIRQAVLAELCGLLDPGKPCFTPAKGKPCVVMLVGLQGSGKTTTCTKFAYHHRRKGFRPAMVCADTFRAGAFDQLKQNAAKANIPFYGSYVESDPVKVAVDGVERFKKENRDLIIIDTSGRHKQETALFEEMRQLAEATRPDMVILVMDSSIGQAAFDQAQAFKQSVPVGSIIVTKMDGHARGGGALSAVAATKSPVIFLGTGEHMDQLQAFDVEPFVRRLLGMGDLSGLVDRVREVVPAEKQLDLEHSLLQRGAFTLRLMYALLDGVMKMGPMGQLCSMLPGFSAEMMMTTTTPKGEELDKDRQARLKGYMVVMDSMTNAELDNTNPRKLMTESRIARVARGSGRAVSSVRDMLQEHMRLATLWSKVSEAASKKGGRKTIQNMLNQIDGGISMAGLQSVLKTHGHGLHRLR